MGSPTQTQNLPTGTFNLVSLRKFLRPAFLRARRPAETVLRCTRNANFLQKVRSRLRKTPTWETRLVDQAPTRHHAGRTGTRSFASWPGPGAQVAPHSRCSRLRETPAFCRRRAPAYAKHYFPHFAPCRGDPGAPLAEPRWAARPKRKTCRPELLTWFRYVNSCGRLF